MQFVFVFLVFLMSFSSKVAFALICALLVDIMLTDFAKQRITQHVEVVRKLCGSVAFFFGNLAGISGS